jgi:SAM-dependent methyltransferase
VALESFSECHNCGTTFLNDAGIPVLIPTSAIRAVTFKFDHTRSVRGKEFESHFVYPAKRGSAGPDKPYHLDLAVVDILERLPRNASVLEIGCGGGQMRKYVESLGHTYVGVDISKTRVGDELHRHGGADLLCDAHFLPFADRSFDLIYTVALTEHLACPFLAAQEINRTLKPGGYYLGNVSFLEPWHDDSYFHMSPLGVYELLTQANFEILNIWPSEGYSGFRALMNMGNKATKPLTFLGDAIYFLYRSANRFRNLGKKRQGWMSDDISDAAKVSGATDWIAKRRLE